MRAAGTSLLLWLIALPASAAIQLSSQCPPSFEKRAGVCILLSPYRSYPSLGGAGVGGLRTGLPAMREGFTPAEIDLGRYLFFDPVLSANASKACASCHRPSRGFADDRARSIGADGRELARNAPSLWNVAFLRRLQWDGRARSLEEQVAGPLYGSHEMGNRPERLLASLNAIPEYRRLFAQAFPDAGRGVRAAHVYRALAAFESSLISLNSRYDLYAHGVSDALSPAEIEGMNVFRSFVARCAECHTPPLFTNQQIAVIGMPDGPGRPFDPGAGALSGGEALRGGFKVPSLRNVALTAPYGHAGQFRTLRDAVAFYTGGRGHAVPAGEHLNIHWHIWEPRLSARELDRLVDFLNALSDESFRPTTPSVVPSGLPVPD